MSHPDPRHPAAPLVPLEEGQTWHRDGAPDYALAATLTLRGRSARLPAMWVAADGRGRPRFIPEGTLRANYTLVVHALPADVPPTPAPAPAVDVRLEEARRTIAAQAREIVALRARLRATPPRSVELPPAARMPV